MLANYSVLKTHAVFLHFQSVGTFGLDSGNVVYSPSGVSVDVVSNRLFTTIKRVEIMKLSLGKQSGLSLDPARSSRLHFLHLGVGSHRNFVGNRTASASILVGLHFLPLLKKLLHPSNIHFLAAEYHLSKTTEFNRTIATCCYYRPGLFLANVAKRLRERISLAASELTIYTN